MSAARYVGRVGGLAVALGIGAAFFTGQQVASATPAASGSSAEASGPSSSSGSAASDSAKTASPASSSTAPSKGHKPSTRSSAADGTGGADNTSKDGSSTATTGNGTTSSETGTQSSTANGGSHGADPSRGDTVTRHSERRSKGTSSQQSSGVTSPASSFATSPHNDTDPKATDTDDQRVQSAVGTPHLLSSLNDFVPQSNTQVSTSSTTPGVESIATKPTATPRQTTPPRALISMTNVAADLVSEVLNPFAGTSPRTPTDTPASWVALAAVRREIGTASPSVAAVSSGPIVYVPVATVVTDSRDPLAGVISSSVQGSDANGLPLAYTVVSAPSAGGKVNLNSTTGTFAFLPDASDFTSPTHSESFSILVHEVTPFVSGLAPLEALPIVGTFVDQTLTALYQRPILNTLLVPLIGNAVVTPVTVDVDAVNPSGNPIAFTTKVISFDGTPISTNFFPALGLQTGQQAPTLLNGPGLGGAGNTNPTSVIDVTSMVPGLAPLRAAGYNVVTWDPRGEFASGGVLQLDSPAFEGKDVQAIINWVAQEPETQLDSPGDPRMGMVGGSYGGGIQLVTAAIDHRVDAIVPTIAWNSLTNSLYPNQTFMTSFGALLLLDLVQAGARINPQIYTAALTGDLLGLLSPSDVALLDSSGPGSLVSKITAPTLLIQGTVDGLFPLQQAVTNAQLLAANRIPVKMIWFCGGHGVCLDPGVDQADQASMILADELAWVNQYVNCDARSHAMSDYVDWRVSRC